MVVGVADSVFTATAVVVVALVAVAVRGVGVRGVGDGGVVHYTFMHE